MHEVICFHCANAVAITPDATHCSVCGEDLQHLLPADATIDYFRERALALSDDGNRTAALAEVERGLTFAESSDLHLLAAILAEKLERFDQMRRHVAAIPVDDTLRGEAEWLLRAHQDRERAQREAARSAAKSGRSTSRNKMSGKAGQSPPAASMALLDDLLGRTDGQVAAQRHSVWSALATVALVAAAGAVVVTSWWWFGPGALPAGMDNDLAADDLAAGSAAGSEANAAAEQDIGAGASSQPSGAPIDPVAAVTLTVEPLTTETVTTETTTSGTMTVESQMPAADVLLPTPTPSPVPSATAVVPPDLVLVPTQPPELADASVRSVVVIPAQIFDLDTFLHEMDRPDLAALNVEAQLQNGDLILQGVVNLDIQRRELVELLSAVPGVNRVSTVGLLLRPLPTYTVQEGDTLWSIVFNIYGNIDRLDEFYRYNLDVLPGQDALAPGMELKVLPIR